MGGHRLIIEERNPEIHEVDSFIEVVQTILHGLGTDFPPFVIHKVRVECLAQPNGASDSIDLLAGRMTNVVEKIDAFERPPLFFGMRFRFPPKSMMESGGDEEDEDDEDDEENEGQSGDVEIREVKEADEAEGAEKDEKGVASDEASVELRFETYNKDVSQVWMAVSAVYIGPLSAQDVQGIGENIRATYKFLAEKAKKFLDQFDYPTEEGSEE